MCGPGLGQLQGTSPAAPSRVRTQSVLMRIYTWMPLPGHAWERPNTCICEGEANLFTLCCNL